MTNIASYRLTPSKTMKGYYKLVLSIDEDNALNLFDIGSIEIHKRKDSIIYELESYINLGYTLNPICSVSLEELKQA